MVDPFADPARPHMARGTYMLGGMPVVISNNIPLLHVADEIEPRPRVLLWLRIVQYVPFLRWWPKRWWPRWYHVGDAVRQEQFIVAAGKLFCTSAGFHRMQEHLSRNGSVR